VTQVVVQLEQLIRRHLLGELGTDASRELAGESLASLVITYLNWRSRFIPARPRDVHLAAELLASPKYTEHRSAADELERKIRAGEDLTPHLSRAVATAYVPRASRPTKPHWSALYFPDSFFVAFYAADCRRRYSLWTSRGVL
jgi:hypothetical protein